MAMSFEELEKERTEGVSSLSREARDVRNAGRRLESEEMDSDLIGAVIKLQQTVEKSAAEQKASNERTVKQMQRMLYTLRDLIDEVDRIKSDTQDEAHSAQQAALNGVNRAQKDAEEITIKNISEVTERSKVYIDTWVQESRRRIERLAMITLPDRLFYFGKWLALILALIILCHVFWQLFFIG